MFQNYLQAEKIFIKILTTAHVTIKSKINEVDKSRIICIKERLGESKTLST